MSVKMVQLWPQSDLRQDKLAQAIARVVESGQYIGGSEVEAFEEEWADYCGAKYCVGVSSGFSALQLIIQTLGCDEAFYSSLTCSPIPLAIEAAGARAIPVAPQIGEYVLGPWALRNGVNVNVLLYGVIDPSFGEFLNGNLIIVDDAAQAHGRNYKSLQRAKNTVAAAWSFYPTKNLGALGDAGAITTNDEAMALTLKSARQYECLDGINARLDSLQAAILRTKLPFLDDDNAKRTAHACIYLDMLKGLPLVLPVDNFGFLYNWHQFPIRVKNRKALRAYLEKWDIETQVHYPCAAVLSGMREPNNWEKKWANTVLSLPVGPHLRSKDILKVCNAIGEYYES